MFLWNTLHGSIHWNALADSFNASEKLIKFQETCDFDSIISQFFVCKQCLWIVSKFSPNIKQIWANEWTSIPYGFLLISGGIEVNSFA